MWIISYVDYIQDRNVMITVTDSSELEIKRQKCCLILFSSVDFTLTEMLVRMNQSCYINH